MSQPFDVEIDRNAEVITIQGIRYSFSLFTCIGFCPKGTRFEVGERLDGVVTLHQIGPGRPAEILTPDEIALIDSDKD